MKCLVTVRGSEVMQGTEQRARGLSRCCGAAAAGGDCASLLPATARYIHGSGPKWRTSPESRTSVTKDSADQRPAGAAGRDVYLRTCEEVSLRVKRNARGGGTRQTLLGLLPADPLTCELSHRCGLSVCPPPPLNQNTSRKYFIPKTFVKSVISYLRITLDYVIWKNIWLQYLGHKA